MGHHKRTTITLEEASVPAGHAIHGLAKKAAIVGGLGLVASGGLAVMGTDQFFFSYLTSFMWWLSIALGGLWFVLIHHATRAGWSVVVRRFAEHLMKGLPVLFLLFLPLLAGMEDLFHWMHPEGDPILEGKSGYLNPTFFIIRVVIFFGLWALLARFFFKHSTAQDTDNSASITHRLRWFAPLGILIYALTSSFAAMDWMMSLDPHWFSTIFGVYYFAGSAIAIFSTLAIVAMSLQKAGLLEGVITDEHYHDLGKLMFGFTIFWTYIAFSQYFLIWYANLPEETMWFELRSHGSWFWVGTLLCVGHFAVPFFFLMPRTIKRARKTLFIGACWMLFIHWVDMYYVIQPVLTHNRGGQDASFHLLDLTTFIGIGGVFVAVFAKRLTKYPLIPLGDPRLGESLTFENM
jgi:hypothetical protein